MTKVTITPAAQPSPRPGDVSADQKAASGVRGGSDSSLWADSLKASRPPAPSPASAQPASARDARVTPPVISSQERPADETAFANQIRDKVASVTKTIGEGRLPDAGEVGVLALAIRSGPQLTASEARHMLGSLSQATETLRVQNPNPNASPAHAEVEGHLLLAQSNLQLALEIGAG